MVMEFYKKNGLELEHTRNVCDVSFGRLADTIFALCSNLSESLNIIREIPPKKSITEIAEILVKLLVGGHTVTPKIKIKHQLSDRLVKCKFEIMGRGHFSKTAVS